MRGARKARTRYRVIAQTHFDQFPVLLMAARLFYGRTHQIRVHMEYAGAPLFGDKTYNRLAPQDTNDGQRLHAANLCIQYPDFASPFFNSQLQFYSLPDWVGSEHTEQVMQHLSLGI